MRIAPEQRQHFTVFLVFQAARTTTHFSATLRGTAVTQATKPTPWAANTPTPWGFTTCQAMFGSFARIGMGLIHQEA